MMVASFNNNSSTTIICYSPTNANDETDLITFSTELSSLVPCIPKHNVLIIGGDMNAQIDKNETTNSAYTICQTEIGIDFLLENGLICLNTKFQKREGKTMNLHLHK